MDYKEQRRENKNLQTLTSLLLLLSEDEKMFFSNFQPLWYWIATIHFLITLLGNNHFAVRRCAYRELVTIVQTDDGYYLLPILAMYSVHPNREIAHRCRCAINEYYVVWPTASPRIPWLDMLPEKYPNRVEILQHYLTKAQRLGWSNRGDWEEYRYATILYTQELLQSNTRRSDVRQIMDKMAANETDWRKRNKHQYDYDP